MVLPLLFLQAMYFILRVQGSGGAFPQPLSAKDEADYLAKYKAGDESAREKLIEHNLRLVAHIVKKYYADPSEQDDLISIGTIGLIKAVTTFDSDKSSRLGTYAARCIENEILMYFRSQRRNASEVSLNETLESDGDGTSLSLLDTISCEDEELARVDRSDRYAKIYDCITNRLDKREREIVIRRYGLYGGEPMTQREISQALHISRSYVSRLEKKALEKLRGELE